MIKAPNLKAIALSADGTRLATGETDGKVQLWDAGTGKHLKDLPGHSDGVRSVAFSPDGGRLVSTGQDKTVRVYDSSSGALLFEIKNHVEGVNAARFLPDGKTLLTAGSDGAVFYWDASSGKEVERRPAPTWHNRKFLHAPHGRTIASFETASRTVSLLDLQSGFEALRFEMAEESSGSVAFSPDGFLLATGCVGGRIQIWDMAGVGLVGQLGESGFVHSLAFSPDGRSLAAGLNNGAVRIWSLVPERVKDADKPEDIHVYWADFAGGDVRRAFRAMDRLATLGDVAVGLLQPRLQIPAGINEKVSPLIKDLDNDDITVREQAAKDLSEIGPFAEPALRQALKTEPSAESQARLTQLVQALERYVDIPPGFALGRIRTIQVLGRIGTPAARDALGKLAENSPSERERRMALEAFAR
jgi:hypothetical protein